MSGKSVGFRETEDGIYESFLEIFPRKKNINEWFTTQLSNYIEKNKVKKESLEPYIENPEFKQFPDFKADKEKIISFCQHTDNETLKEIAHQAWVWKTIAECYALYPKSERPDKYFANLIDMERRVNG